MAIENSDPQGQRTGTGCARGRTVARRTHVSETCRLEVMSNGVSMLNEETY
jgi:hypothetical protein